MKAQKKGKIIGSIIMITGVICMFFSVLCSVFFMRYFTRLSGGYVILAVLLYGGILLVVIGSTIKNRRGTRWGIGAVLTVVGGFLLWSGLGAILFLWLFVAFFGAMFPISPMPFVAGFVASVIGFILIMIGIVFRKKADRRRKNEEAQGFHVPPPYDSSRYHGLPLQNGLRPQCHCPHCGSIMTDTGYRQGPDGKLYATGCPNGRICYECPHCGYVDTGK